MDKVVTEWSLYPAGDRSLVVTFHHPELGVANQRASRFARHVQQALPEGVYAVVPGMESVALHYEPAQVLAAAQAKLATQQWLSPYACLHEQVEQLLTQPHTTAQQAARVQCIPVCYGGDYGPDLLDVAKRCQLEPEALIALHTQQPVDVLMLGFAPGHPYVGFFSERLTVGRRASPRTAVPPGSIGLANRQSVIYPMTLPGGWHLIGRTPLRIFNAYQNPPAQLAAGDTVQFVAISPDEFEYLAAQESSAA